MVVNSNQFTVHRKFTLIIVLALLGFQNSDVKEPIVKYFLQHVPKLATFPTQVQDILFLVVYYILYILKETGRFISSALLYRIPHSVSIDSAMQESRTCKPS